MPRHYPQRPLGREITIDCYDSDGSNDEDNQDTPIYTTRRTRSAHELREQTIRSMRLTTDTPRTTGLYALLGEGLGWRKPKRAQITTAPGQLGAGETETEADEPVSNTLLSGSTDLVSVV